MSFLNKVTLHYNKSILVEKGDKETLKVEDVNIFDLELNQFGFCMSTELVKEMQYAVEPKKVYNEILNYCIKAKGTHKQYNPLFKDFPETKYDEEDYKIQFLHYLESFFDITEQDIRTSLDNVDSNLTNSFFNQEYTDRINHKRIFEAIDENCKMIELNPAKENDVVTVFKNLLSTTVSIAKHDLDTVTKLVTEHDFKHHIPEEIPFKENMVTVAKVLLDAKVSVSTVSSLLKTPTDVLRFTCELCEGDVSLTNPTMFKLKRSQRRLVIELLNNTNLNDEDFLRHKRTWVKLAYQLHVGEFTKKYPNVVDKINCLRNTPSKLYSFNRELEKAYQDKDGEKVLKLLNKRKGVFFRNILRASNFVSKEQLMSSLPEVLKDSKTANLYALKKHLKNDCQERFFLLKNASLWKSKSERKRNHDLEKDIVTLINNELKERFSKKDSLGKVFINPELKNKVAPMNQRFSSKSLKNMPRGSRLKLDSSKDYLRFFTYWENNDHRIDLDLSASGLDKDFKQVMDLSYYNLKDVGGKHSGDITDAPNGATEFIDISKEKLKEIEIRYVLLNVYSFTGQPFESFEARAGFMERKDPIKGNKFEAKTVTDVFELNSNAKNATMVVFDLEENEAIFVDMGGQFHNKNHDNVTRSQVNFEFGLNALQLKPNVHEVLLDHVESRGSLVSDKKDADLIIDEISNEDFLNNYLT